MKKRVIIIGSLDSILIYFTKYLILNDVEIYLIVRKNEEPTILKELEKEVTIVRFDGNVEHLKLLLKSLEPSVIYNLSSLDINDNYEVKDLVEKSYLNTILILEALKTSKNTRVINLLDKNIKDKDENSLNIYSAIQGSLEYIINYYKNTYSINASIKYKTGDISLDLDTLLS